MILVLLLLPSPARAQGDYLTPEETVRIQDAQDLFPRTREYLLIAAARVTEIGRRMGRQYDVVVPGTKEKKAKKPKKGKDAQQEPENPLLFYQVADLVQAISQSLRAVMTNIDERFQHKRTDPKEIARSLRLLQQFISQNFSFLDQVEEKARSEEDLLLYRAVRNVREDLARAQEGARTGLQVLEGDKR